MFVAKTRPCICHWRYDCKMQMCVMKGGRECAAVLRQFTFTLAAGAGPMSCWKPKAVAMKKTGNMLPWEQRGFMKRRCIERLC